MWQTDVLEILGIFAKLGAADPTAPYAGQRPDSPLLDPRAAEALDLVARKQGADGRWKLENTQNGRFVVDIETKGKPSRWVTLRALTVLQAAGRLGDERSLA